MKKRNVFIIIVLFSTLPVFTSCATILSGTKATVTVTTSTGEPVQAMIDGEPFYINGPTPIKVERGYQKTIIEAENEKSKGVVVIEKVFNSTTLWNLLLGGIPGFAIDAATGALTEPARKMYTIIMQPKK